jgi:Ran GTPase-activating protein (RanGAP) involved in mRNA processing and transport
MTNTPALFSSLQTLAISQNKLDDESSRLLGVFLKRSTALSTLKMRSTSPSIAGILSGMSDGVWKDEVAQSHPLSVLDFSRNKVTKYTQEDTVKLLNSLPNVIELYLNGTDVSATTVKRVFRETIKILDISRNYFPDDHIITLMEHLITLTKVSFTGFLFPFIGLVTFPSSPSPTR